MSITDELREWAGGGFLRAGMVPTYHATESVEEAKAVVEQCKTSTERLRAMLDDRGVKWKPKRGRKHDGTEWYDQFGVYAEAVQEYSWDGFEHPEGKLLVRRGMGYLTPEQAIAATLGNGEYERKMDALLCRLTNGKFSKTRTYDLDFMESVVREEFETDAATLGDADLAAENAKLRELISNVHEALRVDKEGLFHELTLASMEDDMRVLGLVVE